MSVEAPLHGVHFVGTLPGSSAHEAMWQVFSLCDTYNLDLESLPSGEVGAESRWVGRAVRAATEGPNAAFVREPFTGQLSYDRVPRVSLRTPIGSLEPDDIRLPYADDALRHYATFAQLRQEFGREVRYQVGIPSPIDIAQALAGVRARPGVHTEAADQVVATLPVITTAVAQQIARLHTELGDDVVVQLESVAVPQVFNQVQDDPAADEDAPEELRVRRLGSIIGSVVSQSPYDSYIGIHLCHGDQGGSAQFRPTTVTPTVNAIRSIIASWPSGRPQPAFVHFPVASGEAPPSLFPGAYVALQGLGEIVHARTRLAVGFVSLQATMTEQLYVRRILDAHLNTVRPFAVAAPCGIVRGRTPEQSVRLLEQIGAVAAA